MFAVNYHYVRPSYDYPHGGVHGLTSEGFRSQIQTLADGWEMVHPREVVEAVETDRQPGERDCLVTFDDGLREQIEVALPILDELGVPAVFFVNTAPIEKEIVLPVHQIHLIRATLGSEAVVDELKELIVAEGFDLADDAEYDEKARFHYSYDTPADASLKYLLNFVLPFEVRDRAVDVFFKRHFDEREVSRELYMTRDHLRQLSARGLLGAHTHHHFPVGILPEARAAEEVARCVDLLEDWTGERPRFLSYPYGSREACAAPASRGAARAGISAAFTMERAVNHTLQDPLRLARFDCNDVPGGKAARFSNDTPVADLPSRGWFVEEAAHAL